MSSDQLFSCTQTCSCYVILYVFCFIYLIFLPLYLFSIVLCLNFNILFYVHNYIYVNCIHTLFFIWTTEWCMFCISLILHLFLFTQCSFYVWEWMTVSPSFLSCGCLVLGSLSLSVWLTMNQDWFDKELTLAYNGVVHCL